MVGLAYRVVVGVVGVSAVTPVLAAALAAWVLVGAQASMRLSGPSRPRIPPGRRIPSALIASLAAGGGAALLVGGLPGVALGLLLGIGLRIGLPRVETAGRRREREQLERQAPLVVDLVAACLASGSPLEPALVAAATAVGPPARAVLVSAVTALQLGADPAVVWRDVARHEPLGGLARAVARSAETGAPLSDLLPRVAERARASHRARVEARVRTVSVRLTAPLGLAFLPAFVLLGVVPVVAAWVGVLL
jgi:Flp pilus assembly protein TadB